MGVKQKLRVKKATTAMGNATGYREPQVWDIIDEDGRQVIYEWSQKRRLKLASKRNSAYRGFLVYTFTIGTLNSFLQNINFMVLVQMGIAALAVYLSDYMNLTLNVHVGLFVSPIVFPLAFSINTDFQRREKVLEDLANFKSSAMIWFFCMRDWRQAADLDKVWMRAVHQKLKSMLFYTREFLMTEKLDRRKVILRAIYEDFSDTNQLIENVRASKLPANTAIVSRAVHLLNMLCLSFERLRVVREYRSPRSIRSFNKVLIFVLPIILSPYFVYMGRTTHNQWAPYYVAILVAFVFSALQGVQDKLDDPFDGMSEDDINLSTIDEWTFHSLEVTVNRSFTVGRFKVATQATNVDPTETIHVGGISFHSPDECDGAPYVMKRKSTCRIPVQRSTKRNIERSSVKRSSTIKKIFNRQESKKNRESFVEPFHPEQHPYADVLDKIQGNTTIMRGGHVKEENTSANDVPSSVEENAIPPGIKSLFKPPSSDFKINIEPSSPVKKEKTVSFSQDLPLTEDLSESSSTTDQNAPLLTPKPTPLSRFHVNTSPLPTIHSTNDLQNHQNGSLPSDNTSDDTIFSEVSI